MTVREVVGQHVGAHGVYPITRDAAGGLTCGCLGFFYRGSCSGLARISDSAAVQPKAAARGSVGSVTVSRARQAELNREAARQREQATQYLRTRAAWDAAALRAKQVRKSRAASVVGNELRVTFPQLAAMASDLAKVGRGLRTVGRWANRHDAQYREARAARAEQKDAAWKAAPTGQVKHEGS